MFTFTHSSLMSIDPFIGTGGPGWGAGSLNPGAQFPHGTLRLGPDTSSALLANLTLLTVPFQHFGGYSYSDNVIRGFSHTHLVGVVGQRGRLHHGPVFESDGNAQALRLPQCGPGGTTHTASPDKLDDLRRVRWALAADSGVVGKIALG